MPWFSGIMVFLLIWWVTLFTVLPLGVRGQAEENKIHHGSEPGAPLDPQLKRKFIRTTIISVIIWCLLWLTIYFGWIDLERFSMFKDQ